MAGTPAWILIKARTSAEIGLSWTTSMGADATKPMSANALAADCVTSVTTGAFNVGTDTRANQNAVTYDYLAVADNGVADFAGGSYTGNGTTQAVTVGFQPDLVMFFSATADAPGWKTSNMADDDFFNQLTASLVTTNGVTLTATGFSVGSDTCCNENAVVIHWIAFKSSAKFNVGTFTGNGVDDRTVTPFTFGTPDTVISKGTGATSGAVAGAIRFDDNSGDSSNLIGANNNVGTDRIQAFATNGFQVGVSDAVNVDTEVYYCLGWQEGITVGGGGPGNSGNAPGRGRGNQNPGGGGNNPGGGGGGGGPVGSPLHKVFVARRRRTR